MKSEETMLAICIPTWNRARYLDNLLKNLVEDLKDFPHSYEIIISDNASTDNTKEVVESWSDALPIRFYRQKENIGMFGNPRFIIENSHSKYSMILADDDLIDVEGLKLAIDTLIGEPEAVILYAPWTLYDLLHDKVLTNFYTMKNDAVIAQRNFIHLISLILQNHIFAEICIVHSETYRNLMPRENGLSYWSFTIPAEYLNVGKVIFSKTPFYKSVTNYFPDHQRQQCGHLAAEDAWDSYRGGLEHLLGLARPGLTEENIVMLQAEIGKFVLNRMLVSLRLRINASQDPIENYYLASRIRGLGASAHLPQPFELIKSHAALWFVTHDESLLEGMEQIILVGDYEAAIADYLGTITDFKISRFAEFPDNVRNAIVILKGGTDQYDYDPSSEKERNNKIVIETHLMNKFL